MNMMMAEELIYLRLRRRREKRRPAKPMIERSNPFHLEDHVFMSKFRLPKTAVIDLCNKLRHRLRRYQGFPAEIQLLTSLSFFTSGSLQHYVADDSFASMSQPTMSRNLSSVLKALLSVKNEYIKFPKSKSDLNEVCDRFYRETEFPNVIGAIGCTHVTIRKPSGEETLLYYNAKNKFSINVQLVCDFDTKILDAVVRWPGSCNDYTVWQKSKLRDAFIDGQIPQQHYLLGDRCYPMMPWLMTPYSDPQEDAEIIYNMRHSQAYDAVERCRGYLKSRFRCIENSSRPLMYAPKKCCEIIMACIVLHNICLEYSVPEPDVEICGESREPYDVFEDTGGDSQLRNKALDIRRNLAAKLCR